MTDADSPTSAQGEHCDAVAGPNCGLCKCKHEKGHAGRHMTYHGSPFGPIPDDEKKVWIKVTELAALESELAAVRAERDEARKDAERADGLALAIERWLADLDGLGFVPAERTQQLRNALEQSGETQ